MKPARVWTLIGGIRRATREPAFLNAPVGLLLVALIFSGAAVNHLNADLMWLAQN